MRALPECRTRYRNTSLVWQVDESMVYMLTEKAKLLHKLHQPGKPLVLFNIWDAVSARIVEELGAPAIATSSAAIAWLEGFPDGERISRDRMLAGVRRVASAVRVPVTADMEGAYGPTVDDAAATARGVIEAGAVGLNFEDAGEASALIDADLQCERIAAMVETGRQLGVPLVINARTDAFLAGIGPDKAWRLNESIQRGRRYLQAGAACVFVPGVTKEDTIAKLVREIPGPINVLANAKTPAVSRLAELGVARVSVGGAAMGHALRHLRKAAAAVLHDGRFDFAAKRLAHAELNELFEARDQGS